MSFDVQKLKGWPKIRALFLIKREIKLRVYIYIYVLAKGMARKNSKHIFRCSKALLLIIFCIGIRGKFDNFFHFRL